MRSGRRHRSRTRARPRRWPNRRRTRNESHARPLPAVLGQPVWLLSAAIDALAANFAAAEAFLAGDRADLLGAGDARAGDVGPGLPARIGRRRLRRRTARRASAASLYTLFHPAAV